ncbi:hypothetical protein B0F87_11327 [Methylobacter tundripaludum]|uniref:Uncharacterized protein n=1 Tax=Methylobacter tundripaludum TaxID=173365 RepID=A0A2S6H929_9GAMM|nr:hypothetical protein [Methylobacter tundripaludum]PPK73916.1 hypothetical protein B0F87_11327 [Methylobacter tundripaludum]
MSLPQYGPHALLILLIAANIILMKVLNAMTSRLKASGEKCGMVHFELAGNAEKAERIMEVWRKAGLEQTARISLWLDFAFLLAYPLGLALSCWALANGGSGWFAQAGVCIGFSVLACTPMDAAENMALLGMLDKGANDAAARLAAICATIKFFLAGVAVLYVFIGLPLSLFS